MNLKIIAIFALSIQISACAATTANTPESNIDTGTARSELGSMEDGKIQTMSCGGRVLTVTRRTCIVEMTCAYGWSIVRCDGKVTIIPQDVDHFACN